MFRPRVIPVLLLQDGVLVKSIRFKKARYIGDPINAVRLFNRMKADELMFLDISATAQGRHLSLDLIRQIGEEAHMPFGVGGGFRTVEEIRGAIRAGAEKVVLGAAAVEEPDLVHEAAHTFGASSIAVCMDVGTSAWGKEQVRIRSGKIATGLQPVEMAVRMRERGAGELIVQSISHDGTMKGYDLDLLRRISAAVPIPVVALGGAGSVQHLREAYEQGMASAVAAGSLFVYHGSLKGVLINYPESPADIFR